MLDIDMVARGRAAEMTDPVWDAADEPLTRFVKGVCRSVAAVAGCLIAPPGRRDGHGDGGIRRARSDEPVPGGRCHGRVAVDAAATEALDMLLSSDGTARRGHGWLRHAGAPQHRGLLIETPMTGTAGQLLLVFAVGGERDVSAGPMLSALPEIAITAGAMHETWLALDQANERNRSMAAVMDQSECGIIVVRADHGVVFCNLPAQAILAARDGIELRRDVLRPTRYQDAVRFQTALDHVLSLPPEAGRPSRLGMMLLLERPGDERPLIAVIAPAAAQGPDGEAAATVYVMRPELSGLRGVEAICQLHGLSPVETQLATRLVAGATLSEAAQDMRVKPDTARAYLKQVFAKTDTHRQADLIQLVIRYQRAVRGDFMFHAG